MEVPSATWGGFFLLMLTIAAADEQDFCASGMVTADGLCIHPERPQQSLLQHRFEKAGNIVVSDVNTRIEDRQTRSTCSELGGVVSGSRCWLLGETGQNCDNTCASRALTYSFSAPAEETITPLLVGHVPSKRQDPWLFVECYVEAEDRYHTFSPDAWGVPEKTPQGELAQVGQYSHDSCRLACPCAAAGTPPAPVPVSASQGYVSALKCEGGIEQNGRCWYLSELGASCASTCGAHSCAYSFAAPTQGDMVAQLIGHTPKSKQDPWLFVECYVPSEDRYHPFNQTAWGVPERTPVAERAKAAQYSYDTCQLSCPCEGRCEWTAGDATIVPAPLPVVPVVPVPVPVPTTVATGPTCSDGIGLNSAERCWYLSAAGGSCDATCTARGFQYLYAAPLEDMTPKLVGHVPALRQEPWLFVECYVQSEDRYHAANPNSYNVLNAIERAEAGQHSYESCMLACPCAGASSTPVLPVPVPVPVAPVPVVPVPSPYSGSCSGLVSDERCWYLSNVGANCDETCSSHGQGCQYSYADSREDITPRLIGHTPASKLQPWIFVECYVAAEDRYHPANDKTWGVPSQTPLNEWDQVGQHNYETCMLSCPCTGSCSGAALAPIPGPVPMPAPVPVPVPSPSPNTWEITGNGLQAVGRTWYLSDLGGNCKDTCSAQGLVFSWAGPPEDEPITPRLVGHEPSVRQNPWTSVECYIPKGDTYHPVNMNAWGVPSKTPASEIPQAAEWSHADCRLACPCTTASQSRCRFEQPPACAPEFVYKGVEYKGCTNIDHDKPWCQHHHHHAGNENTAGMIQWSDCVHTCGEPTQELTPSTSSANCVWKAASTCVKEFNYEGALIVGCTTSDHHSPWCSKTNVYSGSWTHCEYQCDRPTAGDLQVIADLNSWAVSEKEVCNWEPPVECAQKFQYKNTQYEGCAQFVDHPGPWCSHHSVHAGKWSDCRQVCKRASA